MFGSLVALSLLQAAAQVTPQNLQGPTAREWQVAGTEEGCVAHTAYSGGTVVTMFALAGQEGIGFLLQNRQWTDLEDGAAYPLEIRFENGSLWEIPAVARLEIDQDGPGLFFAVRPGSGESGRDFMSEFAGGRGMHIGHNGIALESLQLSGTHGATVAIAQCLSRLLGGNPAGDGGKSGEAPVRI